MTTNHSIAALVLRVGSGGMMLPHGYGKLTNLINGNTAFPDPLGLGAVPSLVLTIFAECLCSLLVVLGYRTKLATIPLAITMLVAAFIVHAQDPWGRKEFALLYFMAYLALYFLGAGKYSLDWKLKKA